MINSLKSKWLCICKSQRQNWSQIEHLCCSIRHKSNVLYRGGACLWETPTCSCMAAGWGQQRCSCFRQCSQWSSTESHIWVSKRRNMTAGCEWIKQSEDDSVVLLSKYGKDSTHMQMILFYMFLLEFKLPSINQVYFILVVYLQCCFFYYIFLQIEQKAYPSFWVYSYNSNLQKLKMQHIYPSASTLVWKL